MAKSIKSGFCSLHLFLQYMQVLCSWNLCNQPNYRTSFKSLKLGFAMGSLAEKLIHFVTKRSIHEFFSQLLTSLNFVAICKGGLIMYLLLSKINFPNLKCRSYWLSYFIIFHPLFCPFSCYFIQSQHIDYYTNTWSGPKFLEKVWCLAIVIISSSLWAKGVFSTPSGIKAKSKRFSLSRLVALSSLRLQKPIKSNLRWNEKK